jgi:hypothetical protein
MKETTHGTPAKDEVEPTAKTYVSELEGVYIYRKLAELESDAHLTVSQTQRKSTKRLRAWHCP